MPSTLLEYIVIIAALWYLVERATIHIKLTLQRRQKKVLKKYHAELSKASQSALMQADLLWDGEAKRLTEAHIQKREYEGTLPEPALPFMDPADFYASQIKASFKGYVYAQLLKPLADRYFELATKVYDEETAKEMTEQYTESLGTAKETLRDVGFDLVQLDKRLVAA